MESSAALLGRLQVVCMLALEFFAHTTYLGVVSFGLFLPNPLEGRPQLTLGFPLSLDESSLKCRYPRPMVDLTSVVCGSRRNLCRVRCLFHYGLLVRHFKFRRSLLQLLDLILPPVVGETTIARRERATAPGFGGLGRALEWTRFGGTPRSLSGRHGRVREKAM